MTQWDIPQAPSPVDDDAQLPAVPTAGVVATQISLGRQIEVRRAALALPRDPGAVRRMIDQMAEWSGDNWEYEFPIGGQLISGPSIRCTNAVARAWGNCSLLTSNVQDIGDAWVIYSTFVDHQTGFDVTRGFRQRKGQKSIKTDAGRAEDIVFQIGVSKSARNVVRNALGDVVDYAVQSARRRMSKKIAEDLPTYRDRVKVRLEEIGYPLVKVEAWANAKIDRWQAPAVAQVIRVLTAHAEGSLSDLDTIFAPKGVDMDAAKPNGEAAQSAQEARQEPAGAAAPQQTGKVDAPSSEARSASAGPSDEQAAVVYWRGKPYQKFGSARTAALKDLAAVRTAGGLEDLRESLTGLCKSLVKVGAQGFADELTTAFDSKEAEFIERQRKLEADARVYVAAQDDAREPEPTRYDPDTGEVEPEAGDGSSDADQDDDLDDSAKLEDDEFEAWAQEMREDMRRRTQDWDRDAGKDRWLKLAEPFGDRGAQAVNEVFLERQAR